MTPEQKKALKVRAHALKPVVWLGQHGLSPAVLAEIEQALQTHELIKVKIPGMERSARELIVAQIMLETLAEQVQLLGQIVTVYRKKEKEHVSSTSPQAAQTKR